MAVVLTVVIIILLVALIAVGSAHPRYRRRGTTRLWRTGARRILFPYVADGLSRQTLDAALRLANAEDGSCSRHQSRDTAGSTPTTSPGCSPTRPEK